MKIFVSWSGIRSKVFATGFTAWIRCVIQGARPWISTQDIPNGAIWFNQIAEQLSDTRIGVICLTKENFRSEWILFEAGALFKGLSTSRVCTILIGIQPEEVPSPLGQLNHAKTTKEGIHKLVREINQEMKERSLDPMTLDSVFEKYWPDFEAFLCEAEKIEIEAVPANEFSEKQMMAEILALVRVQSKGLNPFPERFLVSELEDIIEFVDEMEKSPSLRTSKLITELQSRANLIKNQQNKNIVEDVLMRLLRWSLDLI